MVLLLLLSHPMKLKTLIQNRNRLEVAEVEIEFIAGIPQIHFLGLPDKIIKESFYRIKSALKCSGFKFPLTQQMIVNIKPQHLRKSSRGLELAVAIGILLKTEQIKADLIAHNAVIYGELGLDGQVYEPSDLSENIVIGHDEIIFTGKALVKGLEHENIHRIENLNFEEVYLETKAKTFIRPSYGLKLFFTEEESDFIFLSATGKLHSLLAGDSGAGKSTVALALHSFLAKPSFNEPFRETKCWRTLVNPHPSITPAAFLGGGAQLYEGEIERVQGGLLFLDELLEFENGILEALRGPMTGQSLRLSRGSDYREILPDFQVVATTNLCICGKWTPLKKSVNCRFSKIKCTKYLEKLSGPLLDRFAIMYFTEAKNRIRTVGGHKILQQVEEYFKFIEDYKISWNEDGVRLLDSYYKEISSRRKSYLLKVAQLLAIKRYMKAGFAEEMGSEVTINLTIEDFNQAEQWAIRPFDMLERGMG